MVFSYAGNTAAAEETLKELEALGVQARAVQGSVADPAAVKALIDTAVKELGGLHILVNNAGITRDNLAMMLKEEDFDAVIETNLKGTFLCMKAAARPMMKARYGRIINLSSVVALRGNPGQINYCASKAGVIGMTKSLAKELGGRGITVNAVAPGYIATDPRLYRHRYDRRPAGGRPGGHAVRHPGGPPRHPGGRGRRRGLPGLRRGRLYHRPGTFCGRRHGDVRRSAERPGAGQQRAAQTKKQSRHRREVFFAER